MAPPSDSDELSSLERKREDLYSPQGKRYMDVRPPLSPPRAHEVPHVWDTFKRLRLPRALGGHKHLRLAILFLIGAAAFFVLAAGIAAYLFISGGNTVSTDNITLAVQGPTTVAGGDTVPLSLTIVNRNHVPLKNATLEVDFPDGTRSSQNVLQNYPRYTEDLGTIAPGMSISRSVKAIIFGAQGQSVTLPVALSYETSGSNATFVKRASYGLSVSSAPLSVSVATLSEVVSGRPFVLDLVVRSNATAPIGNVVLTAQYPFGFSVASSSLPAQGSNFLLGTLKPGESRAIEITGALTGTNNDQRVFHFSVGISGGTSGGALGVAYMTQEADVTITAPFLSTTLALNGSSATIPVITPGTRTNATLAWANALPNEIINAEIEVHISGAAVDYNSIQSANGFYRSADHTIVFDSSTNGSLAALPQGASGVGSFSFEIVSGPAFAALRDPTITFTLSIAGQRIGQANVPEQVSSSASQIAKVATAVTLSTSALHASGPIPNSGPVPPRVNQATTYTVIWNIKNTASDIADASVSASLPPYSSYTGLASSAEGIRYDGGTRSLSWSAGDIPAGASAQVAFQVSLTPSTSQKGSAPVLVPSSTLTAFDRFAQVQISAQGAVVDTETPGDPGYVATNADVQ